MMRAVALLCALALAGACTSGDDPGRATGPGAIVLLHGADIIGSDGCYGGGAGGWAGIAGELGAAYPDRSIEPWGYLACDDGYAHGIDHHGGHDASAHERSRWEDGDSHTARTSIDHLAFHLAWALYDHDAEEGRATDIVAHSMGGLIARVAVAETEAGTDGYPPFVRVRSVTTFGTPHAGTGWARLCAVLGVVQCVEMTPGSALIERLAATAPNPQGAGGTSWVLAASDADVSVCAPAEAPASACTSSMTPALRVQYDRSAGMGHSGYFVERDAALAARIAAAGDWRSCERFPSPVALAVEVAGGTVPAGCAP